MSREMVTIKSISKQIRGVSYTPKDVSNVPLDNHIRLLRANNITETGIDLEDVVFVNKKCISDSQKLKVGDILIAASSGSIKIVGKAILIEEEINSSFGAFCKVIRPTDKVDFRYLSYYFRSSDYRQKISHLAAGANINNLRNEDLDDLEIPLPPLTTQKRIAEILDAADALKRKDQELLKKYDELAQAIFIDMFGDPVKNEKGWEVKKLKEICNKITDGTHFSPPNQPNGIPYITAKHLKKDVIDFYCNPTYISQRDHKEIFSRCTPVKGDVLYIKDGATTGIAAVNEYEFEFSMLSSLALIKPRKDSLNSYYLSCYLNNEKVKQELIRSYMAGAAIKRFTLDKINKFDISLPPIELQNSFEARWKKLNQSILFVKESKSNNLFKSLIQKAFSGKLVN